MTGRSYNKDGNTIAGFSYGYDAMGNKLYQQDTRDPQASELYAYDNRDRLISWERGELNADKDGIVTAEADQNWNLDPVGNWDATTFDGVTEQRDHNAVNELTHRENGITADLRYDDNGNLIEDSEYEYAYDAFNREDQLLVDSCWLLVDDGTTGNGEWSGKGKSGKGKGRGKGNGGGNGGGTGGETIRTYTYGNYIDEPITMTSSGAGPSGTYYYHTNNLYNVRALTDSSGQVVERYRYTAYGEPTILDDADNERPKSAVGNPYMFQGRRHDAETGLYYYRNRYYSAELGRFVTRDPMGYVDGYNMYQYAGSYLTGASDPMGLWKYVNPPKERKKHRYAKVMATQDDDPYSVLANLTQLDSSDVQKWLKGYKENDKVEECDTFKVPNTVYIDRGGETPKLNPAYLSQSYAAGSMAGALRQQGYHVIRSQEAIRSKFVVKRHIGAEDAWGYYYWGHGGQGHLILSGVKKIWQRLFNQKQVVVEPDRYSHHKIARMWLIACRTLRGKSENKETGKMVHNWEKWRSNVSSNGILYGYVGPLGFYRSPKSVH